MAYPRYLSSIDIRTNLLLHVDGHRYIQKIYLRCMVGGSEKLSTHLSPNRAHF